MRFVMTSGSDSSNRRRHLMAVAVVIVSVFVAAEAGARAIEPRLPERSEWGHAMTDTKVDQMNAIGNADIVVLGSSTVVAGVDAALLAQRQHGVGYNAGLSGATPRVWRHWSGRVVTMHWGPWEKKKDKPWHATLPKHVAQITKQASDQLRPARLRFRRGPARTAPHLQRGRRCRGGE